MKLTDLTPPRFACVIGTCPAVYRTDRGTYVLVGQRLELGELPGVRIGEGETAIEVSAELLEEALCGQ
jgi:hypothetical protein